MYIVWDKIGDANFRDEYFLETGERIQSNPQENAEGTHYMVGSSRITVASAEALGCYYGESKPEWWTDIEV
tara:strand:+ start:1812 stop:2024 length:213 start_codon:yes stop_codon:yes gene_type:complete